MKDKNIEKQMSDFTFEHKIVLDKNEIQKYLNELIRKTLKQDLEDAFKKNLVYDTGSGRQTMHRGKGAQYIKDVVDKTINEYFQDEEAIQEYIVAYIDKFWIEYLNQAMKKALQHKANALAFKGIKRC